MYICTSTWYASQISGSPTVADQYYITSDEVSIAQTAHEIILHVLWHFQVHNATQPAANPSRYLTGYTEQDHLWSADNVCYNRYTDFRLFSQGWTRHLGETGRERQDG